MTNTTESGGKKVKNLWNCRYSSDTRLIFAPCHIFSEETLIEDEFVTQMEKAKGIAYRCPECKTQIGLKKVEIHTSNNVTQL